MEKHPVILSAEKLREYDQERACEMVEALLLQKDSSAQADGAYCLLGQIYLAAGDVVSARDAFEMDLKVLPDSCSTFLHMGLVEEICGNKEAAESWYSRAPRSGFDFQYVRDAKFAVSKWAGNHHDSGSRIKLIKAGQTPPPLLRKLSFYAGSEPSLSRENKESASTQQRASDADVIDFECPMCAQHIEAGKEMAGSLVQCPACSKQIIVTGGPVSSKNGVLLVTREVFLKNLVVMILSDGTVGDSEYDFLCKLTRLIGVDAVTGNRWIEEAQKDPPRLLYPPLLRNRQLSLDLMIAASKSDEEVNEQEMDLLRNVARFFHLSEEYLTKQFETVTPEFILKLVALEKTKEGFLGV